MSTATLPTPIPATPLMTAEEFLAKHGDDRWVELVKGRLVEIPMPGAKHGGVCSKATYLLTHYSMEKRLGRVMSNDTFVQTGDEPTSFRGGDVIYLSYARLPREQELPIGPSPTPDLVFEVRSPHDRMKTLIEKAEEYLEAGVHVVVLLFPETMTAAIHRPNVAPVSLASTDLLELPDILPGFSVPVNAFFE